MNTWSSPLHSEIKSNHSARFYDKYSEKRRGGPGSNIEFTGLLSFFRQKLETLSFLIAYFVNWVVDVAKFGWRSEDLDYLHTCVDCSAEFGTFKWRYRCANCDNIFCSACLNSSHQLHNGRDIGKRKRSVCVYCFFQLCARHCGGKCCEDLSVSQLRKFLNRKGISMFGAVEKRDLVESVKSWATDLSENEYHEMFAEGV